MPQVLNLTFHGIGKPRRQMEPGEDRVWVSPEQFRGILDVVRERRDVTISFDDGNLSDCEIALPELLSRGLTADFYLVASRIGQDEFVGRDGIKTLLDSGMRIGSHGMRHRPWRRLGSQDLHEELWLARDVLQQAIGRPVTRAACPFGDYGRRTLRALQEAGFDRVFTSDRGRCNPGQWLQPRTSICRDDGAESVRGMLEQRPSRVGDAFGRARIAVKRWR